MFKKKRFTVLVIDDEIDFLSIAAADLEKCGVEVYTASNGLDGYDFISTHSGLDLVISDIKMPKLNGIELLRRVRIDLNLVDLRFVLITGYPEIFRENLAPLNPSGIFEKPIGLEDFNRILNI